MTVQQAYKIFDVRSDITKMELKKRYRRLMHMVHPDAVLNRDNQTKKMYIDTVHMKLMKHILFFSIRLGRNH